MSILKNRLDNHKSNMYKKANIFGSKNISFTFKTNMKSVNISSILFNNFFKSKDNYYNFVKKEYHRIINGNLDLDSYNLKPLFRNKTLEEKINKVCINYKLYLRKKKQRRLKFRLC